MSRRTLQCNRLYKMCIKIDSHIKHLHTSTYKSAIFEYFWLFGFWVVGKLYRYNTNGFFNLLSVIFSYLYPTPKRRQQPQALMGVHLAI